MCYFKTECVQCFQKCILKKSDRLAFALTMWPPSRSVNKRKSVPSCTGGPASVKLVLREFVDTRLSSEMTGRRSVNSFLAVANPAMNENAKNASMAVVARLTPACPDARRLIPSIIYLVEIDIVQSVCILYWFYHKNNNSYMKHII